MRRCEWQGFVSVGEQKMSAFVDPWAQTILVRKKLLETMGHNNDHDREAAKGTK
jgi:hypothetical protein